MSRRIDLAFSGGHSDVIFSLDPKSGMNLPLSYEQSRNEIHERLGGEGYYTARSGLSGAGYINYDPDIRRFGTYGCTCNRSLGWDKIGKWNIMVHLTHHGKVQIDPGHPVVAERILSDSQGIHALAFWTPQSWDVTEFTQWLAWLEQTAAAEHSGGPLYECVGGERLHIPVLYADEHGLRDKGIFLNIFRKSKEVGRGLDFLRLVDLNPYQAKASVEIRDWQGTIMYRQVIYSLSQAHIWARIEKYCQDGVEDSPAAQYIVKDQHALIRNVYETDPLSEVDPGERYEQELRLFRLSECLWRMDERDKSIFWAEWPTADLLPAGTPDEISSQFPDRTDWHEEVTPVAARLKTAEEMEALCREKAREKVRQDVQIRIENLRYQRERAAADEAGNAAIATLDPDREVTVEDSVAAGNCRFGTEDFMRRNFGGRQAVKIYEALKFRDDFNVRRVLLYLANKK